MPVGPPYMAAARVCRPYGFNGSVCENETVPLIRHLLRKCHLPLKGKACGQPKAASVFVGNCQNARRGGPMCAPRLPDARTTGADFRRGHTPGWLLSAFGRFTFSLSPTGFKKAFRFCVGEPLGAPARIRSGSVGSANSGAKAGPHQKQILRTQGPCGPGKNRTQALLILRAGNFLPLSGERPS